FWLKGDGFLKSVPGAVVVLFVHGAIDVRAGGVGDAPPCHGAIGVGLYRAAERADGFGVVEREAERQALVEVTLGELGFGGDGVMEVAEVIEERGNGLFGGEGRCAGANSDGHEKGGYGRQSSIHSFLSIRMKS